VETKVSELRAIREEERARNSTSTTFAESSRGTKVPSSTSVHTIKSVPSELSKSEPILVTSSLQDSSHREAISGTPPNQTTDSSSSASTALQLQIPLSDLSSSSDVSPISSPRRKPKPDQWVVLRKGTLLKKGGKHWLR